MICRDAEAPLRGRTPLETGLQMLLRHISYRLRAATVALPAGRTLGEFRGASLPVGPYCNRTANLDRKREIPAAASPLTDPFAYPAISRKYNAPIVKKRWSGTLFDAHTRKRPLRCAQRRHGRPNENARRRAGRIRIISESGQARQASRPSVMRSCGNSMPMNTILLFFFSIGSHLAARSLPIIWCTPWNTTLRSTPFM